MKETILRCDHCKPPRKFAVTTLVLQNGKITKDAPSLDLCQKHVREMQRFFKPRSHTGRPFGSKTKRSNKTPTKG